MLALLRLPWQLASGLAVPGDGVEELIAEDEAANAEAYRFELPEADLSEQGPITDWSAEFRKVPPQPRGR